MAARQARLCGSRQARITTRSVALFPLLISGLERLVLCRPTKIDARYSPGAPEVAGYHGEWKTDRLALKKTSGKNTEHSEAPSPVLLAL